MRIYLHGDRAEQNKSYSVHIAPAADISFHKPSVKEKGSDKASWPAEWVLADGSAKQFEIVFSYGVAEVDDSIARYMVARGIAHRSRLLRQVRQFFSRDGQPIEELFDANGERVLYDMPAAA